MQISTSHHRLPTRVVDCTDPDHPRLVSTEGRYGRYVTLSYVWGGDQVQKTTTSNISAYEHGIEPSLLPATIRDAIHATHALGVQSIWIDSLCIIQDSDEDKLRELGRMHLIYRHAFLTIIAASASGVTEGFLQARPVAPRDVSLPFICPPQPAAAGYSDAPHTVQQVGRMRASTTYTAAEGSLQSYTRALEPINARGWCLQEYYMSPRSLIFTSESLQFRWRRPSLE